MCTTGRGMTLEGGSGDGKGAAGRTEEAVAGHCHCDQGE